MLDKLLAFFRKATPQQASAATQSPPTGVADVDDARPPARWLSQADPANPFVLDGFDCLHFVSTMLSTTQDPEVAASFTALRSSDGSAVHGALPEDPVEIPCALAYPHSGETRDGPLFKASAMEEKWDIHLHDRRVYFCRSWTGMLALVAEIDPGPDTLHIARLWAPRSTDAALAIRQVDYLVKSHLYQRRVPHPLPPDLERQPATVALYSFSQYGRLCCFGSFDDTLGTDLMKPSAARTSANA